MRFLASLLAILFLLVIQAGVLMPLHMTGVNLLLIFLVSAALISDFNVGLGLTLMSGLFLDFLSGMPDGVMSITMIAVFLILHFVVNSVFEREPNQIILFSSVAATTIVYYFFVFVLTGLKQSGFLFLHELPRAMLFNFIFVIPVFQYYLWINQWQIPLKSKI